MGTLKTEIERLRNMLPREEEQEPEPTMRVEFPDEWWAPLYEGLQTFRVDMLPALEKIYGDEARRRGEHPHNTAMRYAAYGGQVPGVTLRPHEAGEDPGIQID